MTLGTNEALFDPWFRAEKSGGPAFGELLDEFRSVQELIASSRLAEQPLREAASKLREAALLLRADGPVDSPDGLPHAGNRHDLPGRGHPLLVPFRIEEWTSFRMTGLVRFGAAHLGGNDAVHGGVVPLLFDEVLGRLSNTNQTTRARTAYLHVNYRMVTPLHRDLRVAATVDREEGRKQWLSATLTDGDSVLVEAEGLFVRLRPGQQ